MSAYTHPIIVNEDHAVRLLERLPLTPGADGAFSERWLQTAIFAAPEALPVREIDPHIGPLIPVCMEIETGAGPADILFITPTGQVTLVETKLWRNPEARRVAVAQVLDYAKQLSGWTFDDLDREASSASRQGPGQLLRAVRRVVPDLDEAAFTDGVNRSLREGDFLLLIVGDGIRSGAQSLVGFIQQYGSLRFHIGLIEVAAYRLDGGQVLLQPRVLARTEILTRTVVIGPRGLPIQEVSPETEEVPGSSTSRPAEWFQQFWSDFKRALSLDDRTQPLPARLPRSTNFYFPMPPNGGSAWLSAYLAQSQQRAGVYLSFAKAYERAPALYELLLAQRMEIERTAGLALQWERDPLNGKIWISAPPTGYRDLDDPAERQRVIDSIADQSNRMINALRHRLLAIGNDQDVQ
jgi:hypothetical protein